MERLQRTCIALVFVGTAVAFLGVVSYAAPPSDSCILVRVGVADEEQGRALVDMGLDIWEFWPEAFVIRLTRPELDQVRALGYEVQVIAEDVYTYLETHRRAQIAIQAVERSYHPYDEVVADLQELEASGIVQATVIGTTHEGRDIWAVKISDNPFEEEGEPGALFMGCHHAREWISVEVPLYLAEYLVDHYEGDEEIKRLVDHCEIWIVPVVNPDGYVYTWTTDRLWRKNRRDNGGGVFGVDLNRNYGYMWGGAGSSSTPSNGGYRGPSAFSEPESRAVRDLVLAREFRVLMSYHSYWQVTYTPWAYTQEPCADGEPMRAMTFRMRELIEETSGAIYTDWWDTPGTYVLSGDTGDWGYGELGIYSFGIELPPVTEAQGGFVLPESRIQPTCEENLPVGLYLIALAVEDGGITNLRSGQTYGSIQFAINDANDGDAIVLDPGLYHESVFFMGRQLTLRSTDPNDSLLVESTVVEGYHQGSAINLSGATESASVIAGLTITGETAGVSSCDASPTLSNCTIGSNEPNAIVFWEDYEPTIVDCNVLGEILAISDPRLVAQWKLDETEGLSAYNSAGAKDGIVVGSPNWRPDAGMVGGALELDGATFVISGAVLNPSSGPFSVFAWVKGGAPGQVILSQEGGVDWLMADTSEGALMTELKGTSRSSRDLASETIITDGNWHRVGFVWDGSDRALYVDDIIVAQDTQDELKGSTGNFFIGRGKSMLPAAYWAGMVDDVRIYDRAIKP